MASAGGAADPWPEVFRPMLTPDPNKFLSLAVSGKNGRLHPRVVHPGNGQSHDDGGNELLRKISGAECQPESDRRRAFASGVAPPIQLFLRVSRCKTLRRLSHGSP